MLRKKPGKWFEDENIQRITVKGKIYIGKKKRKSQPCHTNWKNQKTRNWLVKRKKPPLGLLSYCYVLTFDPAQKCHSRWCTGRRWHILMAVMRGNRVGGNWQMKWDEQEKFPWYTTEWCTGREWPLNCMTVISAWWRLNIRFQRSSGRRTII